jgi:hypothetical protein
MVSASRSARSSSASAAVDAGADGVDLVAQPEPDVGGDLIVARAPGVQALAGVADHPRSAPPRCSCARLRAAPTTRSAGFDAARMRSRPATMASHSSSAEDALAGQHARVGDGAGDVLAIQAPVEADRCGEGLDEGIGGLVEAPGPGLGNGAGSVMGMEL